MPHDYRGQSVLLRNADGKLFLQFRDGAPGVHNPLQWDFFGGGYEPGEDLLLGARRELREELGIDVSCEELQVVGDYTDAVVHEVIIICTRPVEWDDVRLAEGAGCAFLTKEEALRLELIPRIRAIIERHA